MFVRHNWTRAEIRAIYTKPLLELVFEAQTVHRQFFKTGEVQKSTLLSIKTGGCPEDCTYCPQSAHYETTITKNDLLDIEKVMNEAMAARKSGSTRFCMGAAWREVKEGQEFDRVVEMVSEVAKLDMEVCCTLGMLTEAQAVRLKNAGLDYYNHNLDTSPEFYGKIITTRTCNDRLQTLENVRKAGLRVCCGGIIGMGETEEDRIGLLHALATLNPHPESVPINVLVHVEGTPLNQEEKTDPLDLVRMIATARLIMPRSMIRLSAGRNSLSREAQALCFMAGANSIFAGEKLLTTPNPEENEDKALFAKLGLKEMGIA